ncbi:hypothetical protein [Stakelama marina]|uniref:DUF883 family protein n=1 Tax=Stakelama marina TaxID=2826939 RepID=A0A8T4IGV0_9SPHN|nr:hypothetical protein [Stakelama marina]MBR0551499.1 hypothetical protein [Stakelama marina]
MTDTRTPPQSKSGIRAKARSAIDKTQESASETYSSARKRTRDAAHRAGEGVEANPLAVLIGGAAVGMLAGALIPSSEREKEALRPVGKRVAEGAKAAALAARDAGKEEFESLAPDRETAKNKASGILGHIAKAAVDAGKSAATEKKSS